MKRSQRISTIERQYPDEWVLVEVTRVDKANQAIAGRVLGHSPDRKEITRETIRAREEDSEALLWAFYTGDLIPPGMIVVFGCG